MEIICTRHLCPELVNYRNCLKKEKSDYIQQNARQMEEQVYPAYEDLIQAVEELKGKGTNEKGLCYFPEGRKYYEWYIQQSVGVTDTIQELEQLTRRQI